MQHPDRDDHEQYVQRTEDDILRAEQRDQRAGAARLAHRVHTVDDLGPGRTRLVVTVGTWRLRGGRRRIPAKRRPKATRWPRRAPPRRRE